MIRTRLAAPKLFYRQNCRPCRWLSRLAVALSANSIQRVPIGGEESLELYRSYPERNGQLMLLESHRVTFGGWVFAALPLTWLRSITGWRSKGWQHRRPKRESRP